MKIPPRRRPRTTGGGRAPRTQPPEGLAGVLEEVRATVLTLLASLQDSERTLRRRARSSAAPGIAVGLGDIRSLRDWADRTLHTLDEIEAGRSTEVGTLLEELSQFDSVHG